MFLNSDSEGLWLEKKSLSNMGRGVTMIKDVGTYRKNLVTKKKTNFMISKVGDSEEPEDSTELFL